MSKYAKNYLPIMFNLYTTDVKLDESTRQSLVDTIKHFLKLADAELVNSYLTQATKNYQVYTSKYDDWLKAELAANKAQPIQADEKKEEKPKRVIFDFNKSDHQQKTKAKIHELIQPYLFAKYAFLDLIAVLVVYSNRANIDLVCQLALSGISVICD